MNGLLQSREEARHLSDDGIQEDGADLERLEATLKAWLVGRVRNFRLFLREEGLELRGEAHSYYAKQLAQHAVMKSAPWPIVANAIVVF